MTAILSTYGPRPLTLVSGFGTILIADDGVEYLDCVAGIATVALGHAHPAPIEAFARQASVLGHVSNLYWTQPSIALAERLLDLAGFPDGGVFFCNSGAEANEAAIKLARRHGRGQASDKVEIVALERGFHGRTMGALAATWARAKKDPFEPLPDGFRHVPGDDVEALAEAVSERTAAILIEPIQGEGGVWPIDDGYLRRARELADEHGALLIYDEVQTGIGRTGAWFRFQETGVVPDAICLAKGLGSGLPIGALVTRQSTGGFVPGDHGTTFGGSPPIAAGALAVLDTIEREGLVENARTVGAWLAAELGALSGVASVRGAGLLLGVELAAGDSAGVTARLAAEQRIIVNAITPTALRICPPLVFSREDARRLVDGVAAVLPSGDHGTSAAQG